MLKEGGVTLYLLKNAATWMDLEISILSAISPTEKDKCQMVSLIYGIFFLKKEKIQMNLFAKQK